MKPKKTIPKKTYLKFIKLFSELMNSLGASQEEYNQKHKAPYWSTWFLNTKYGKLEISILNNPLKNQTYYSIYCKFQEYSRELAIETGITEYCYKWNHCFSYWEYPYDKTTPEEVIEEMNHRFTRLFPNHN